LKTYKIQLTQEQSRYLLSQPEKGMGYQVADIFLKNGEILESIIILNCEFAETEKKISPNDIFKIVVK
jgi:hypothetical protein